MIEGMYTLLALMMIGTAIAVGKILKAIGKKIDNISKEEYEQEEKRRAEKNNGGNG